MGNLFVLNGLGEDCYGGALIGGRPVWQVALERVSSVSEKLVVLVDQSCSLDFGTTETVVVEKGDAYATFSLLLEQFAGYDNYIFYDLFSPFLEPSLGLRFADVNTEQVAHFTYGEHYPRGVAPQVLSQEALTVLRNVASGNNLPFTDETILDLMGIDINSYDIEIEVSAVDFRRYRLDLRARSFHNKALLEKIAAALGEDLLSLTYEQLTQCLLDSPQLLRVLPAYIEVDLSGNCNLACAFCPREPMGLSGRDDLPFMEFAQVTDLADQIKQLNPEAVVAFSPYSEPTLHPKFRDIIRYYIELGLKVLVETNGVLLDQSMSDFLASFPVEQLIVIVSIDTVAGVEYKQLKKVDCYQQVVENVQYLLSIKERNIFLQILNTEELAPVIEQFYTQWQSVEDKVLPRKYNNFVGRLAGQTVADFSPLKRSACWHLARDLVVRADGSVPMCKQDLDLKYFSANVFADGLAAVWQKLGLCYDEHLASDDYKFALCESCDEWYTYNY